MKRTICALFLLQAAAFVLNAQVVINEYSCANLQQYTDQYGKYEDWIELYNTSDLPVDIGSYYLSDDEDEPTKWQLPASVMIAPKGYFVVYASGRNEAQPGAPFHTNFGQFTRIGKHVFINHACSFLDLGGITIEDHVLIGPRVNLVTENHPLDPADRRALICKAIVIKRNAWIGAASTILPGVTIGENAVVAAGSVVTNDVPANTVVAGIPAKHIKNIP